MGILQIVIDAAAALFGGLMLLRFWMQAVKARPAMQIANFVFTLTNWLVLPLRKVIPGTAGLDWASLIAALLISLLAALAKSFDMLGILHLKVILVFTVLNLLNWFIYGMMGLLLLVVIFSWVNPHAPIAPFVNALVRPFLAPIRKVIPPISGIDLSVMVAFLALTIAGKVLPQLLFSF